MLPGDSRVFAMSNVVNMNGLPIDAEQRHDFVCDMARYADGILTEQQVRRKWRLFTDEMFEALGHNEPLIEEIETVKLERIRSGTTKRERAQMLVTEAPAILSGLLLDPAVSPRYRIDSAKALDDFATGGPAAAAAGGDRFVITINLGGEEKTYNKAINVTPNDVDAVKPAIDGTPKRRPGRPRKIEAKDNDDAEPV
jgi:hypothetical protein